MMEQNKKLDSIASHVAKTFESFRGLKDTLAETNSSDDCSEGATLEELLHPIENEFTRFKMWAGNQAAHQSGPSSLDHRLREAPHLQQQVIYLLRDMCESLQDASSKISNSPDPLNQAQEKGRAQDDDASSVGSAQDEESDFSDSDSDFNRPTGVLPTILIDVGEAIDCLLRLSVAIANPAPHERFRKLGAGPSEDVSFYEPHDITYVRDKFPKISDELANGLGKFITRRRQFFKYRHVHHEKLASGIETLVSKKETDTGHTEIVPKTVASSLPEQFKTLATFDPQAAVIDEDIRSDTGMSQTSYATSAGFTLEGADQEICKPAPPLRVPPRPSAAGDGIFECPFCYRMISAKTRTAWKRHVFGDLRPYTCILSHCTESNTDFDRRHNWQLHVSKYHWRSWSCPFKCRQPFSSTVELSSHIKDHHLPTGSEDELQSVTALGEKPAPNDTSSHCLLCGYSVTGLKKYVKHVGRHLEQLALFALPCLGTEDQEEEKGSNDRNSVKSGTDANSLGDFSTNPSPIFAPQQKPSNLPTQAMAEEEFLIEEQEEEEEEETGPYDYDENLEGPHSLSDIARGKLPATHDFSESIQSNVESSIAAQDEQQRRRTSAESIYKLPLLESVSNTIAKHETRLKYEAELMVVEERGKTEAEGRARYEGEAVLKFGAELRREAEGKKYQTVEELQQLEADAVKVKEASDAAAAKNANEKFETLGEELDELQRAFNLRQESELRSGKDGMIKQPLMPHELPSGHSKSQQFVDHSLRSEDIAVGKLPKGLPETRPEPESMDMAIQADRGIGRGQGLPQVTQLPQDIASLPQEDKDMVVELATKWFDTAPEQQKSHTRSQLQTRMSSTQLAEMESQGTDPLIWWYQNQAFQVLKTNGALSQGQLDLDTVQVEQTRSFQCDECHKFFSGAEHMRRHKLSHSTPDLECPVQECRKNFHHQDLLERHVLRHTDDEKLRLGDEWRHIVDMKFSNPYWDAIPVGGEPQIHFPILDAPLPSNFQSATYTVPYHGGQIPQDPPPADDQDDHSLARPSPPQDEPSQSKDLADRYLEYQNQVPQAPPPQDETKGPTTCTNCWTQTTPLWRQGVDGRPLCNACGLFLKLHGIVRPLSLERDVILKRNRGSGSTIKSGPSAYVEAGQKELGKDSELKVDIKGKSKVDDQADGDSARRIAENKPPSNSTPQDWEWLTMAL